MKKLLLTLILTAAAFAQSDIRVGGNLNVSVKMGYDRPLVGTTVSGDLKTPRLWGYAEGHALSAKKIDGGNGVAWGTEGSAHVGIGKNIYTGGGVLFTETRVEQYTKNALHPFGQVGVFYNIGTKRDSLFAFRYLASGDDKRNHLSEFEFRNRLAVSRHVDWETRFGITKFHATDSPLDHRTGVVFNNIISWVF